MLGNITALFTSLLLLLAGFHHSVLARDFVLRRSHSHSHSHGHGHVPARSHHHSPPQTPGAGPSGGAASVPPAVAVQPHPKPTVPLGSLTPPTNCTGLSPLVKGCPIGFGAQTTGGGTAAPVYPTSNAELAHYLAHPDPQVIVLTREFNFIGTEGRARGEGCAPWGQAPGCQVALNLDGWCAKYEPHAPKVHDIEYDVAGARGLVVSSHKTLVGRGGGGSAGVLRGKGLRIANADNVIVQNVHITELNARVIWAGDALDVGGASTARVWIDHVTLSEVGRQMLVIHEGANRGITVSNVLFDGETPYSNRCNGQHYWTAKISGTDDSVSMVGNHFRKFLGRSPQVGGASNTAHGRSVVHVFNNVWEASSAEAHAFEVLRGGVVLAEGNYIAGVPLTLDRSNGLAALLAVSTRTGTSTSTSTGTATSGSSGDGGLVVGTSSLQKAVAPRCRAVLGRECEPNVLDNSGAFDVDTGGVLSAPHWASPLPRVLPAHAIRDAVVANAGFGKL